MPNTRGIMSANRMNLLRTAKNPHGLPWFALRVRTRAETTVEGSLRAKGFDVFLPTYLECRSYSDRIKKIQAALFPGYLFCRLDPDRELPALRTSGVEDILRTGRTPAPISDVEIASLQTVIAARAVATPWPYLTVGQCVRIEHGALGGLEGVVVRIRGTEHLILSVHLLRRSVRVEIDRTWIRPVALPSPRQSARAPGR